jgi:integrase/recombinase XerD
MSKNTIKILSISNDCVFISNKILLQFLPYIDDNTVQQFIYKISSQVNPRSQARIISGLKASSLFNFRGL